MHLKSSSCYVKLARGSAQCVGTRRSRKSYSTVSDWPSSHLGLQHSISRRCDMGKWNVVRRAPLHTSRLTECDTHETEE